MDYDVSTLMLGTLGSGGRDEFGKEKSARTPLLLDRIMGGQPRASSSKLLQMPAEILADIVDFLADDKHALSSLALVNSDCRQLARSSQFSDVIFDYSFRSSQMAIGIFKEAIHSKDLTFESTPSIGICIRRVTVASHRGWVCHRHPELYRSIFGDTRQSYTREQRNQLAYQANKEYVQYRTLLLGAIADAMPNLEALAWHDRFAVDATFFQAIMKPEIRYLKLCGLIMDKPYRMEPPLTPSIIPLRHLHIDNARVALYDDSDEGTPRSEANSEGISVFFETLLQRCASTLESLYWDYMDLDQVSNTISFSGEPMTFPRLRYLKLEYFSPPSSALSSFLAAPLRHLQLESNDEPLIACEPIRDLETLVTPHLTRSTAAGSVDFLRKHPHIRKLSVAEGATGLLDKHIIPVLCTGRFSNISSLSLQWGGPGTDDSTRPHVATVAEASLEAIGTLTSLEQLRITAGMPVGWRHQWLIDHDMLRANLKGLKRLRILALCRDTYRFGIYHDVEGYYEVRMVGDWERAHASARPDLPGIVANVDGHTEATQDEIWELAHRNRMLEQAEAYAHATVLPALEWIYCGQWPMGIKDSGPGSRRIATTLTSERDSCETFLNRQFGMAGDD